MFIALYGVNNIGKTTQVERLKRQILEKGFTVEHIKYPIYNLEPTGPQLDYFLRNPQAPRVSGEEFQLLYLHNRIDFEPQLQELLQQFDVVLAEDYIGTGIAWGMTQGVPLSWLEEKNFGLLQVFPDLEILMDGERFLKGKEAGHRNEEDNEQIATCRKNFLFLADYYKWPVVNAGQSEDAVAADIWKIVEAKLVK